MTQMMIPQTLIPTSSVPMPFLGNGHIWVWEGASISNGALIGMGVYNAEGVYTVPLRNNMQRFCSGCKHET